MSQRPDTHPMFILGEETERASDRDAQWQNIQAAMAVASAVRSTLGPKGMDKMLVDSINNVTVTNDGVTILKQMDVEHPTANLVVEVASTQANEAGDGTTTAVSIAGELLANAQELIEQGVHPAAIIRGLNEANRHLREELKDISDSIEENDEVLLEHIAETTMTGRSTDANREFLANLVVEAVAAVTVEEDETSVVDREYIHTETQTGRAVSESEVIRGAVLDEDPVSSDMPHEVENARFLLLDQPIEHVETEAEAKISVEDPTRIQEFLDKEEGHLRQQIKQIIEADANVVFCQKGITDQAVHGLAKNDILAVQQVNKDTIEFLKNALSATIVTDLEELTSENLGSGTVRRDVDDDLFYLTSDSDEGHGVTMVVRGSTEHIAEEIERTIGDALDVVSQTINDGRILAGGGAVEVEMSQRLRGYADSVTGREQLAVEAVADALEIVPNILATNAGLDPIDILVDLRSAHEEGNVHAGLNVFSKEVQDMYDAGVIEPAHGKEQAIDSAIEVATLVLKIDDIIAAGDLSELATEGQTDDEDQDVPDFDEISTGM